MEHSELGASGAYRWCNCTASVGLSKDMPNSTSEAAEEGTKAHDLAEKILTEQKVNRKDYPEDMLKAVDSYVGYVKAWSDPRGKRLLVEERFSLEYIHPTMFGTNDACIYDADEHELEIIDYKHGTGEYVAVENNFQLQYYALGATHKLESEGVTVDCIQLTIVQPRYEGEAPIRSCTITRDDLAEFEDYLTQKVKEVFENPQTKLGDWCKWCTAKAVCPAQKDKALTIAKAAFNVNHANLPPKEALKEVVTSLSVSELSDIMNYTPNINKFLSAVKEHCLYLAKEDVDIPGQKLVKKRTNKEWAHSQEDTLETLQALGFETNEVTKLLTPTQVLKLAGQGGIDLVGDLITQPDGDLTLAPTSDKRQSINLKQIKENK